MTNLADQQIAHIRHCKTPAEAWTTLCNIHETKSLSNILFLRRRFFTTKMQEEDDLLDHVNKIKALAHELACLEAPVTEGDVVMTLLESLPPSFEFLITALETRPMKELTLEFVTARLMHEVTKRKENEPQGEGSALVPRFGKGGNTKAWKDTRTCFKCGKQGHIAKFCRSNQAQGKESAHQASKVEDEEDFAFATHGGGEKADMFTWIVDSGATQHMTSHRDAFHTYQSVVGKKIYMGDNGMVEALGIGEVHVEVQDKGQPKRITIREVLHVPKLHANLLSVSKLALGGLKVQFNNVGCVVRSPSGMLIASAPREGNLYLLRFSKVNGSSFACVAQGSAHEELVNLWHRRLGHLNLKSLKGLQHIVKGLDLSSCKHDWSSLACKGCIEGKQARQPFPKHGATRATKKLELVHSDVCGPMKTTSMGGARYFVTFIDDFSRKIWVCMLKCKSEVFGRFETWKALVEAQSDCKVKVLRSDNGGEYVSKAFEHFLKVHGIEHHTSAPYTPQQNGVAERANRTIVEMARAMIHGQGLKYELWGEAVSNAVYTRNRCPTQALVSKTPQEAWSGVRPHVSRMRVFGCIAYALVPNAKRTKLDAKGIKCIFLGYCEGTKAYRLMRVDTKAIIKCRDVIFLEDGGADFKHFEVSPSGRSGGPAQSVGSTPSVDIEEVGDEDDLEEPKEEVVLPQRKKISTTCSPKEQEKDQPMEEPREEPQEEPRYPTRTRKPLGDWWMNHILPPPHEDQANVAFLGDPSTLGEVLNCEDASKWEVAMEEEYKALIHKGTWELAPLPPNRSSVGCKWVFSTKRDALGHVVRYKARLVARGFTQVEGVDFNETFAPVAKFNTIRCVVSIGAAMDLEMHNMDVKTAFLNPKLEEVIYMDQPQGFVQQGKEHLKCKLKKALPGLKQSGRAWYQDIDAMFVRKGFQRGHADHSLYIMQSSEFLVIVVLYVDDLILLASSMTKMLEVKAMLKEEYEMTDLGELSYCLGVEFKRDRAARTITMSQHKYLEEILKRFNIEECKAIGTPLDTHVKLPKLTEADFEEVKAEMASVPYKAAVGCLMYAMVATRPDLAFPVSVVSQHMSKYGPMHWAAVKRVMRYLQGTLKLELQLGGANLLLRGYCDADWAGDEGDRRFTTGYVFMLGVGAISWNSKRQPTIALSTTEAEYMAMSQCTKEAIWLRQLLADVGFVQQGGTQVLCDNQGAIALAKNPTHYSRTKHIDVQHHFIREQVEDQVIELKYVPTQAMVADVLTKALGKSQHLILIEKMGLGAFAY